MPFSGQLSLDEDERPLKADVDFVGSDLIVSTAAGLDRSLAARLVPDPTRQRTFSDNVSMAKRPGSFPTNRMVFTSLVLEHWGASTLASAVKAVRAAAGPRADLWRWSPNLQATADRPSSFAEVLTGLDRQDEMADRRLSSLVSFVVLLIANTIGGRPVSPLVLGTVATTTTIPAVPFVFQTGLDRVALMWNDAASDLGLDVFLLEVTTGNRLQTPLSDNLVLSGSEDPATPIRSAP